MAYSTTSTMAGFMETLQANATARFAIGSRLHNHVMAFPSTNANTVQFPVMPAPSPVTTATAQTASISDAAITVSSVTTSPAQIGAATIVSTASLLGGQGAYQGYFDVLMNDVVAGYDYDIAGEFDDLTDASNVTDSASWVSFRKAKADLADVGYGGQMHGAFSEAQMDLILVGITGIQVSQTQEYIGTGYVGNLQGVELVALPSGFMQTSTNKVGAIWYKEFGIGVGYHAGESAGNIFPRTGNPAPIVHLKEVGIDVVSTNLSAAVFARAAQLATTGGVTCKFAIA